MNVGGLVAAAEKRGSNLNDLPKEDLIAAHPSLVGPEVASVLDPARAVERRRVLGGPSRERVIEAIAAARKRWQ